MTPALGNVNHLYTEDLDVGEITTISLPKGGAIKHVKKHVPKNGVAVNIPQLQSQILGDGRIIN